MTNERKSIKFLFVIITVLLVFISLFPLVWVVRMSFTPNKIIAGYPSALIPPEFSLSNFARVFGLITGQDAVKLGGSGQSLNFFQFLFNSLVISTVMTISQVFFSALGAYAFARLRFPGRKFLFNVYLSALMVPAIVMMIPNFILVKDLGWLNTYMGILAPSLLMTPFAVFFLRQFFLGINKELEEAAIIDGAGRFRIFFRIILPMSQTALATLAIITFINQWNDYLWPLIVGKDIGSRMLTVALGVFRSQTPNGNPDWGGLMAGTVLAIVPTLVLFVAFGKKVVNSIGFSGFR
jgi:multiple sugar transport system permease protein